MNDEQYQCATLRLWAAACLQIAVRVDEMHGLASVSTTAAEVSPEGLAYRVAAGIMLAHAEMIEVQR
jgi:hypothetical protein